MEKEKLDRYGNKKVSNGCKSKKDLRAWVREQNRLRQIQRTEVLAY